MPSNRIRCLVARGAVALLVVATLISIALGFGMTPFDAARLRAFGDAVGRWQINPDFRDVQREYIVLGVDAMQARPCGISVQRIVMAFRSLPGLPPSLSVNDTSAAHYRAFSRGELSAYLHLAREQGVGEGVAMIEDLARRHPLSDADLVAFLSAFKLPVPVATDAGAIAGVRRLLRDVSPTPRPFTIRDDIVLRLAPGGVDALNRDEQGRAFEALDARVRAQDPELWRAKQVSDFLAGIWAQGYGQIYRDGIEWFFAIQRVARLIALAGAIILMWVAIQRRRGSLGRRQSMVDF